MHPPLRWTRRDRVDIDGAAEPVALAFDGEAAFGGAQDTLNPIGRDGEGAPREAGPPMISYPDDPPKRRGKAIRSASLGPISPVWPARAALSGTYDMAWEQRRAPLVPEDLDPAFWQSAQQDQRLPRPLPGAAVLSAGGFDATGPVEAPSEYALPILDFDCSCRVAGRWIDAPAEPQSIWADLDTGRVSVTYLAAWVVPRASDDVAIGKTVLHLWDSSGFRVRAADSGAFHRQSAPQVAAT